MLKSKMILIFLMLMPGILFAGDVHYFSNGKKVVLKEDSSNIFKMAGQVHKAYLNEHGVRLYSNQRLFVQIPGSPELSEAEKWCEKNGLSLVKRYKYIPQWYLVEFSGDTVLKSAQLVEDGLVVQAEPSFYYPVELKSYTPDDPFFPNQWHLNNENGADFGYSGNDHAHVLEAWNVLLSVKGHKGEGVKLAIIDDGFDLNHEDLAGRFLQGKDFNDGDDLPMPGAQDAHGTCCAGVAGANTGNGLGVAGACPDCDIIPIRMNMTSMGSLDQGAIETFTWAADQGAMIMSNSWGPPDNGGAMDMGQVLKDLVTNLTATGRDGKGIIILFAAGNGNESIETDGFASNPNVFAIGASNASGKRCSYSDFGMSLDFMAPSNDVDSSGGDGWSGSYVDGIWSTDNTSGGYVPGQLQGDDSGKYVSEFGGTSSACPLAAGITGLVLSANPDLTKDEVYEIYKTTSDKVSMGFVNPGEGDYDSNGFSTHYGYGRINACEAVKKALEMGGEDMTDVVCGDSSTIPETPDDTETPDESETTDETQENPDDTEDSGTEAQDSENVPGTGKMTDDGCSCSVVEV